MRPLGPESGSFVPRSRFFFSFRTHPGLVSKFEEDGSQVLRRCWLMKVFDVFESNKCFGVWLKQNKVIV